MQIFASVCRTHVRHAVLFSLGALTLGNICAVSASTQTGAPTAAPGQSVTISASLNPGETLVGAHVVFFMGSVRTAASAKFTKGQSTTVSTTLSLPATIAAGTYNVDAEIYTSGWTAVKWVTDVASLTVAQPVSRPTISGKPLATINVGSAYSFKPTGTGPSGKALTYSIQDKPTWATFNATTGALTGTPVEANVGSYQNIVVSVSDGIAAASLPAFSVTVAQAPTRTATVDWAPPTENADGSVLTNLAGYNIYYGTSAAEMSHAVKVTNPGLAAYTISDLAPGNWYFAISSYNSAGVESAHTGPVEATL
jgi:hypothetical protein